MNILPGILTFLSHEKWRMTYVLKESLKIPQRLHNVSNHMISYRNFSIEENNSIINNLSLLQHNINKGIITRFKRGKNTQSSCTKDNIKDTKQHGECIKNHQQSAESCEEPHEWRSDGYQISTEGYQRTCSDLLSHHEYYQSIESSSPIYSNKPVPYNDLQACESSKHESYKSTRITSEKWICGKSATERKIYYKCKPKPCIYPDKSKQIVTYPPQRCRESESRSFKKIILNEKETYPARDTYEYYIKPDPPPPRYQHWSENPPPYCDHCLKKTCSFPVKAPPMIFISEKGPRRSRAKDTDASSLQNIHEDSSKTPNENECSRTDAKTPHLQKSVSKKCVISFEDKCAASLTIPTRSRTMESKIQQFPIKNGCVEKLEKKLVTSDVSDCNPNMAGFNRLSKCPCIKEMWDIDIKREPPVDVSVRQKQGAILSCKKIKRLETTRRKRRKFNSRILDNGWTRQRYKIRLKIFQKGNGRLDPCLPRIVELIHPRGEKMKKLLKSAADKDEFSSQSRNPHYCSSKMPIAETKSYPTKMNESRVIRDQYLRKHPCKKHR